MFAEDMATVEFRRPAKARRPVLEDVIDDLPPLEYGDRLTRPEFHRRYEASPEIRKAELIEGVVYIMSSPLKVSHGSPHGKMMSLLGLYEVKTTGVELLANTSLLLDGDNEVQPDCILRLAQTIAGAHSHINADEYVEGAPELVVEISGTSASKDLGDKFQAYRRNGVQEYLVWRVYGKQIDWWGLVDGEYQPLPADESGIVESRVFPGLRLDLAALLAGKPAQAYGELERGIASEPHRDFVVRLTTAAGQ